MDSEHAKEIAERDQFWASLRRLRIEIDRLARGEFDGSDHQRQMIRLLAQVAAAELDFRRRDAAMGDPLSSDPQAEGSDEG